MEEEVKKFKIREEKHLTTEVEFMTWSPSMDLLAVANINAEVFVNRLSWQRVWSLNPVKDGDKVGGLSWRPDGKVIAVGYKSGNIRICDVEKGDVVHFGSVPGAVTSLAWLEQPKSLLNDEDMIYAKDNSDDYLPSCNEQALRCDENTVSTDQETGLEAYESFRTLTAQKSLNILLVGTDKAEVHLFSYGVFPTGIININASNLGENIKVDSAVISPDLSALFITLKAEVEHETNVWIQSFDTSLLYTRCAEIRLLAAKYVMIASARLELQVILEQMCAAWEELLMEMDKKLLRFADEKKKLEQGGTVSNDFLELLLFGTTSPELQSFLLVELTDKGLKKLGFSISNSYTNLQRLVVRQLLRISQNITSHLNDLNGMAQWYDKFGRLGLNPELVNAAVKMAGAFAVSGVELQQVIETSLNNFKAFFRWLYIAILRLSNRPPPPESSKMSQQDIKFVGDFLRDNFIDLWEIQEEEKIRAEEADEGEDSCMAINSSTFSTTSAARKQDATCTQLDRAECFKLEKVGQYLKNEDLVQAPLYHENPWVRFLQTAAFRDNSPILYPSMHGKSMLQRKKLLDTAIFNAVLKPATVIGASMHCNHTLKLFTCAKKTGIEIKPPKVCQFTDENNQLWVVYVTDHLPCPKLTLMKCPITNTSQYQVARIEIGRIGDPFAEDSSSMTDRYICERHQILDFAVFNEQTLTLLLLEEKKEEEDDDVTLLLQLPLSAIPSSSFICMDSFSYPSQINTLTTVDVGPLFLRQTVDYQQMTKGHSIAVGGIRTTASVLLSSGKRIRLYLLEEVDDEDEEDEEGASRTADTTMASNMDESRIDGMNEDEDKENMSA